MGRLINNSNTVNSPKASLLVELSAMFLQPDLSPYIARLADDVVMEMPPNEPVVGKSAYIRMLDTYSPVDQITIDGVIAHGVEGVVYGSMQMKDRSFAYSDLYVFTSAGFKTIKRIRSLIIETTKEKKKE